jgi:NADPH:quinone reductase-like Zn-dependent oxidoreductase
MQAIVYRCYGSADVLKVEQIARPTVEDDQVLVRVRAAALNPLDWHYMTGTPYIMRLSAGLGSPKDTRVGVDFAGTVEAVGKNVTRFKPGEEVFGGRGGALAEYVTVREDRAIALKPANVTFEQAGAVGVAAVTALQALRDHGRIRAGQKVLVNGASGGVGTFAVQIARSFGAEVTGVCSTRNVELVQSLGADHVVDYKKEDFTQSAERYDLILDNVGNHSFSALRRVLKDDGVLVMVGGPKKDPWLGPITRSLRAMMLSPFVSQELVTILAELKQDDLSTLAGLMEAGKVTPVIDRRYTLSEVPEAMEYMGGGHARGKVVVNLAAPESRVSAAPRLSSQ